MASSYQKRVAKYNYQRYLDSRATRLSDVYGSWSREKEGAWDYCLSLMQKYSGRDLRVVTHNGWAFTAGFTYVSEITGKNMFMFITKSYDVSIEIEEE